MNLKNAYLHFRKIQTHRKWVRYYCWNCGLFWQGITHDLSKYSPSEFLESVRYYQGDSSPITAAKKANGYSSAWLHHRGRNKHHWAYWMDNFDDGGENLVMPFKYFLEMVCDFLGACRTYSPHDFSFEKECIWWENERKHCAMNEKMKDAMSEVFFHASRIESEGCSSPEEFLSRRNELEQIYDKYTK